MQKKLATFILPAMLAVFSGAPASAQVHLGVTLPGVHIHIAPEAPPPPRYEERMVRPGRHHVWIAGYWDRQDDRWAWAPGRWEEPQEGSYWVRPQYRQEYGAYRYEPGRWSHQRMEEGEDYSRWRNEHGRGHGHHGDHGRGNGRDRDHDDRRGD